MDLAFADRDVWGFLAGVEGAKTLVFTRRHPLPSPLVISLNRSLSLCLCPSQPAAINHLKWTALTGSWLHHSFIFFLFFFFPLLHTRSSRSLTHCSPPRLPLHNPTSYPEPPSRMRKWPGVKPKQTFTHLLNRNL